MDSFGVELVLDLYNCREGVCDDLTLCYNFLDQIVPFLGMEKQAPPYIFVSDATKYPDKAGLSGWAPLIESSIVIHTLSPKNYISLNIYCCREFDVEKAVQYSCNHFGVALKDYEYVVMTRGKKYHA